MENCSCDETLVAGLRVPMPRFHDCDYVRARNALIQTARPYIWARIVTQ
jgi:hypothetical protein